MTVNYPTVLLGYILVVLIGNKGARDAILRCCRGEGTCCTVSG